LIKNPDTLKDPEKVKSLDFNFMVEVLFSIPPPLLHRAGEKLPCLRTDLTISGLGVFWAVSQ